MSDGATRSPRQPRARATHDAVSARTRGPGMRAGLTGDQVLATARSLVEREGIEALTMRRLSDRLGVAPNALYSYYANKAALLDAFLDSVLGEVDIPSVDAMDWRDGLVRLMSASRAMLLTHADLLPHLFARPLRGPNITRLGEEMLALLARGGVEGQTAVDALRSLLMVTYGAVVIEAPRRQEPDPAGRQAQAYAAFAGQVDQPRMARLAHALSRPPTEHTFEASVRWLIDGIARRAQPVRKHRPGGPRRRRPG